MAEMTTFGVKMPDDQKDLLQERIKASGMTAADYLAMVISSFDAQQHRETMIDDAEVKLLDSHLSRISEIYLSMAKNRADEKQIAQQSQVELENNIKTLKSELFDLTELTKAQLAELRVSTDVEIELASQRAILAEQNEFKAVEDKDKAESNELQTRRAFVKLEEYNTDLKTQLADAKQSIIMADSKAAESHEQVKVIQDALSVEHSISYATQSKNKALTMELQRVQQELNLTQQNNERLLSKLDNTKELKDQAIGELKAVNASYKASQETIAGQSKVIEELKQQLWKYTEGANL